MAEYGRIGLQAVERGGVKYLARLNWYTIEFGLIRRGDRISIYGAGIVSSHGEARSVIEDPAAHFIAFEPERVMRTGYYIDDLQASYFVIDDFSELFAALTSRDPFELFATMAGKPQLTPFAIEPGDALLRRGTGEYWRDFPQRKIRLK
jgi:phenylalanine-4-hydroxylase